MRADTASSVTQNVPLPKIEIDGAALIVAEVPNHIVVEERHLGLRRRQLGNEPLLALVVANDRFRNEIRILLLEFEIESRKEGSSVDRVSLRDAPVRKQGRTRTTLEDVNVERAEGPKTAARGARNQAHDE